MGARRGAARHQTPAPCQGPHAFRPRRTADMFDHHVDAAPVRQAHDLRGHVLLVMVNDLVRPGRSRAFQFLVRARGREHAGAVQERDLDGCLADAAAGSEHQDVLAALQLRTRDQHVPGGEKRQRKRRRADKVDGVWN